jgi:predicted amidophosphoribosyltransferase
MLRQLGGVLLDWIYPPLCAGCSRWMPIASRVVCDQCVAQLERADLGAIAEQVGTWPMELPILDAIFALWAYGPVGTVRRLQHQLKYQNRPWIGFELGKWVGEGYIEAGEAQGWHSPDCVRFNFLSCHIRPVCEKLWSTCVGSPAWTCVAFIILRLIGLIRTCS